MTDRQQITTRIPKDLHRKVRVKAAQTGQTVTEVIKQKLEEWVREDDPSQKKT